MDYLFVNHMVRDKESVADFYKRRMRRPSWILIYILYILMFVQGIYHLRMGNTIAIVYIGYSVFGLVYAWIRYRRCISIALERDLEILGKPVEITSFVSNDEITQKLFNGLEASLPFDSIQYAIKTPKNIYLFSKGQLIFSLNRKGFSVGDDMEFLDFLRNIGIKIK